MPWSSNEGKSQGIQMLWDANCKPATILDVGPGAGAWGGVLRNMYPNATLHALEVWEPYIERFRLRDTYSTVILGDMRSFDFAAREYGLIVFGDVIEHVTKDEAVKMLNWILSHTESRVLVSIPIIHWEQGEAEGNPHEAHLHHWGAYEFIETFPVRDSWVGEQIGVFLL